MIRAKRSLSKTEFTDTFIYCPDSSDLFSFSSGAVLFQLSLPNEIKNGVYSLCDGEKYFSDYMLFSVNQSNQYMNYPGIYAAFSPDGIVFTVWTKYGKFSVFDTITNISENESFVVDFCWDSSGRLLGNGATLAIFVNDECTASGNFLINQESMIGLNFYAFDSKDIDFNLVCFIEDFACFSSLPNFRYNMVSDITNNRFSDDELVLIGRGGGMIHVDGFNEYPFVSPAMSCYGESHHCIDVCDVTGDIFFCSFFDDSFKNGVVSKFDVSKTKITKSIRSLKTPRAISVIQKDGIKYPENIYYEDVSSNGVWIAESDMVIRADSDLVVKAQMTGFSNPSCIKSSNDMTAWVSDTGNDLVKHVSYDCTSIIHSVALSSPTHLVVTIDGDVFVFSSTSNTIFVIKSGLIVNIISVGTGVVDIDVYLPTSKILVAYSDGRIRKYDKFMKLEEEANPCSAIDAFCIRRGYNQDAIIIVDVNAGRIIETRINDMGTVYKSVIFKDEIFFNGGLGATARNVGVVPELDGEFALDFTVGMGIVTDTKSNEFKVDKRAVDLTDGGIKGAYRSLRDMNPSEDPTDEPEGIIRSTKF